MAFANTLDYLSVWREALVGLNNADIVVFCETGVNFIESVIKIFERFRFYSIMAKPSKIRIVQTSVEYVGWELSHDRTRIPDEIIWKVLDFPFTEYKWRDDHENWSRNE